MWSNFYTGSSFLLVYFDTLHPSQQFSFISGQFPVLLGWTSTKQQMKGLAQGQNTLALVSLKLATHQLATAFLSSADYFCENNFFLKKNIQELLQSVKTGWIQIWPDIFSGLIWVQTVCKGDQQKAIAGKVLRVWLLSSKTWAHDYQIFTATILSIISVRFQVFCLFGLILYIPVNNFSVMPGRIFLCRRSTNQRIKHLA